MGNKYVHHFVAPLIHSTRVQEYKCTTIEIEDFLFSFFFFNNCECILRARGKRARKNFKVVRLSNKQPTRNQINAYLSLSLSKIANEVGVVKWLR